MYFFFKNFNFFFFFTTQVQGIGPTFKLIVKVQNISSTSPVSSLFIAFTFDENLYKLSKTYIEVSLGRRSVGQGVFFL